MDTLLVYKTTTNKQQKILLKIGNITDYITYPPQIAYKLIEVGRSEDTVQVQSLSIDRLN